VGEFPVVFPLRYSGETAQTNFVGLLKAECTASDVSIGYSAAACASFSASVWPANTFLLVFHDAVSLQRVYVSFVRTLSNL